MAHYSPMGGVICGPTRGRKRGSSRLFRCHRMPKLKASETTLRSVPISIGSVVLRPRRAALPPFGPLCCAIGSWPLPDVPVHLSLEPRATVSRSECCTGQANGSHFICGRVAAAAYAPNKEHSPTCFHRCCITTVRPIGVRAPGNQLRNAVSTPRCMSSPGFLVSRKASESSLAMTTSVALVPCNFLTPYLKESKGTKIASCAKYLRAT